MKRLVANDGAGMDTVHIELATIRRSAGTISRV